MSAVANWESEGRTIAVAAMRAVDERDMGPNFLLRGVRGRDKAVMNTVLTPPYADRPLDV